MTFWTGLLNFLLPPRCLCCQKIVGETDGLCQDCFQKLNFIAQPYCQRCGRPFTGTASANTTLLCPNCLKEKHAPLDRCRSALVYDDFSKIPILALKFEDHTENARIFARFLKNAGRDILRDSPDMIMPVPLHFGRLLHRRYNQSALIARAFGRLTDIPFDAGTLTKIRATKPQVSCSGAQRRHNVKGAFAVKNPQTIKGKRIVLIDDVLTTGATLNECAKVLKAAGAASVEALTVARVVH
jgi:ComF family protein